VELGERIERSKGEGEERKSQKGLRILPVRDSAGLFAWEVIHKKSGGAIGGKISESTQKISPVLHKLREHEVVGMSRLVGGMLAFVRKMWRTTGDGKHDHLPSKRAASKEKMYGAL